MKIVFFSPYLTNKHAGGGEKHLFDTALAASHSGVEVFIAVSPLNKRQAVDLIEYRRFYTRFMGQNLDGLRFVTTPLMSPASLSRRLAWTKQFNQLYYVTDGSLFFSLANRNHLHIQIPFLIDKSGFIDQLKLKNWQIKNTNSEFTKQVIEQSWKTKVDLVHYPLINIDELKPRRVKKQKLILSVGRFFKQLHSKRQDVLVEAFTKLVQQEPKLMEGWRLVLVGADEDRDYVQAIKSQAKGYPVEFYHQLQRLELVKLYQQASFYWHAAGYGVDELKHPEKVEHFGITTVEAMVASAIPLVVPKGGQKEILGDNLVDELGWQTVDELVKKTVKLMRDRSWKLEAGRWRLEDRLTPFTQAAFDQRVKQMFEL